MRRLLIQGGVALLPVTALAIPLLRLSWSAAAALLLLDAASLGLAMVLLARHRLALRSLRPASAAAVPPAPTFTAAARRPGFAHDQRTLPDHL